MERRFAWDPRGFLAQVGTQSVVSYAGLTGVLPGPQALGGAGVPEVSAHGAGWMSPDWHPRSSGADPWGVAGASQGASVSAQGGLLVAGMEWMQARVYDPASRAFLSTDPLDAVPGAGWAGNPYSFAGNDPLNFSDPLGLRPLTDADLAGYHQGGGLWGRLRGAASFVAGHVASAAQSTWGALAHAASSAWDWAKEHKEYIAATAMAVGGTALLATGIGGPAGLAMLTMSGDTFYQQATTGHVNATEVAFTGLASLVAPGAGGLAERGAMAATRSMTSCLGRNVAVGVARYGTEGAAFNGLSYLGQPGPKTVGGLAGTVASGFGGGAAFGTVLGPLTKITGSACFAADTQVLMGDGWVCNEFG